MDILNLMRSVFPKTIDKNKPVFSALVANENGDAALQKQIVDLLSYMKEWTSTPDIYRQSGDMLIKTITFFSFLERFADESERNLKERFRAIFVRNHDEKWGTPFDVKNVFKQYFPRAVIYLVENTNKIDDTDPGLRNLLLDGDIAEEEPTDWTLTNCNAEQAARFSGAYGISLKNTGAKLSQTVDVNSSSTYFLHFFIKGSVLVQIKNNSNKYWDNHDKTWKSSEVNNVINSIDAWNNRSLFFITEEETESVSITFLYNGILTYIDYFRLFAKQNYSSFTVIVHFDGNTGSKVFGLAAGDDDPNIETTSPTPPQPRYSNYGYFDQSFLSGVAAGYAKDVYEELLDYLRSQGVKAYLDIVVKDY